MTGNLTKEADLIDIFDLVKIIWKYNMLILMVLIIGLISTFFYNEMSPKVYRSSATFFLPLASASTSSSGLMDYARALGASAPSNLENYILFIAKSRRMQDRVKSTAQAKLRSVNIDALDLSKNFSISKGDDGLFTISFENQSPQLAQAILYPYLDNLGYFNNIFEFSGQKKVIQLLDSPNLPSKPYKPKKVLNFLVATFFSLFLSFTIIWIIELNKRRSPSKDMM